jgi:hypothetical protein
VRQAHGRRVLGTCKYDTTSPCRSTAATPSTCGASASKKAKDIVEEIAAGAQSVFVHEDRQPAAKAAPTTTLTRDVGDWVCTGSDSVFIELCNASRRSDHATCDGQVVTGAPTVFYGGAKVLAPGCGHQR